jgi:hypothetical protein
VHCNTFTIDGMILRFLKTLLGFIIPNSHSISMDNKCQHNKQNRKVRKGLYSIMHPSQIC